ncbi:MAG: ABC transporter ATP-binding protein [Pseudomonadales bacterium]|nr:ABC transporter ATP-binding protein [Pseudomonadales bacterium]
MKQPMLTAENVSVERGGRRVLSNVSFCVDQGEVFALLGGNGAGKSTTLLTFLGFIRASGGTVKVNGMLVSKNIATVRQQMAYLPESANLYPHLSAYENLNYFLSLAGLTASEEELSRTLDRVSLDTAARQRRLESYSKGMRQKVAIALAILRKTPVILLDEPTSGLDPLAIDEFNQILLSLAAAGTTVLMVTHDVYGACRVARRVGLLQQGQLVGEFTAPTTGQISVEAVHSAFAQQQVS